MVESLTDLPEWHAANAAEAEHKRVVAEVLQPAMDIANAAYDAMEAAHSAFLTAYATLAKANKETS